jgi:glycosyltransferase involved in cell wall biosynthesis
MTSASAPSASVILSAYDNMAALVRSLLGYEVQSWSDFEVIVADDGTDPEGQRPLMEYLAETPLDVRHLWQEDRGFRKSMALNRAVAVARAPYLIFSDADIIPRRDFVENHLALSKKGRFIAGGSHLDLPEEVVEALTPDEVRSNHCFQIEWLRSRGILSGKLKDRLGTPHWLVTLKDLLTQRRNAFNGSNGSVWKDDAMRVNGFDEEFGYGGLDRDFGCRLTNAGIRSRRFRYSLVALHQRHPRPYRDPKDVAANKALLRERCRSSLTWVETGLDRHLKGEAQP